MGDTCRALAAVAVAARPMWPTRLVAETPLADDVASSSLSTAYVRAIQAAVQRNWLLPDPARPFRCTVAVEQRPGGGLVEVVITDPCDATEAVRQSLLAAIGRAEPLPYGGFEPVFQRNLRLTFHRDLDP